MNYPLITPHTTFQAVVLCDGDYPTHHVPLSILNEAKYVCCCDNASLHFIKKQRRMPQLIVGDGDSLPQMFQQKYADIFKKMSEQDDNDQTKATRICIQQGAKRIAYLGATGKREDHTLSNISLMVRYLRDFCIDVTMITDYGYFIPSKGDNKFATFKGQQVSVFNFGSTRIESKGLKWDTYPFTELWQGSLNEALGNEIEILADGYYLVYRTFDAK